MKKYIVSIALLAGLVGCSDPNAQSSAIVREVERAGAGDASSLQMPELVQWFANQPPTLTEKINQQCIPLRQKAPAAWHMRTAEGRICEAAGYLAPLIPHEYTADPRRY